MTEYRCALRHSNRHCPVYFEQFPVGKCNKKCPAFISSSHNCKNKQIDVKQKISIIRGLGTGVDAFIKTGYGTDEEWLRINYCPYCGTLLSYGVTALMVAHQRFMDKERID